jgi:hypothetical protein
MIHCEPASRTEQAKTSSCSIAFLGSEADAAFNRLRAKKQKARRKTVALRRH